MNATSGHAARNDLRQPVDVVPHLVGPLHRLGLEQMAMARWYSGVAPRRAHGRFTDPLVQRRRRQVHARILAEALRIVLEIAGKVRGLRDRVDTLADAICAEGTPAEPAGAPTAEYEAWTG